MKTEEQAKQCWCPERAKETAILTAGDRNLGDENYEAASRCIASECMLWLWAEDFVPHKSGLTHRSKYVQSEKGYCGLVKP